jgi:hypothetical protein
MIPRFRAWIKKQKAIVETSDIVSIDFEDEMVEIQNVYFVDGLPDSRDLETYRFDEIKLMQSTGLKDKNGKEIFEGDIVDYKGRKAVVKWHGSYASFIYRFVDELQERKSEWKPLYLAYYHFEVIGNIYENKELLDA